MRELIFDTVSKEGEEVQPNSNANERPSFDVNNYVTLDPTIHLSGGKSPPILKDAT